MSAHDQAACLAASLVPLLEACAGPDDAALAHAAIEEVHRVCDQGQ